MKYLFLFFIGLVAFYFSCQKYKNLQDDVGSLNYGTIRGRLFLNDNLTGTYNNGNYPVLTNRTVTLSYYPNTSPDSNYVYATQTDSNGYFVFNYLAENKIYELHFIDTSASGLVYQAYDTLHAGNDSLSLIAAPSFVNTNGFWLYFTDSSNSGPIDTVSICVFTNPILVSDTSCASSTYQLQSDSLGRAYLFNIPQQTYYLLIRKYLPDTLFHELDTIKVGNTIVEQTIYVH